MNTGKKPALMPPTFANGKSFAFLETYPPALAA